MRVYGIVLLFITLMFYASSNGSAEERDIKQDQTIVSGETLTGQDEDFEISDEELDEEGFEEETNNIPDPIEPFNRAMFWFNDNFYFLVLKPISEAYGKVIPEKGRTGIRRFFSNITTPIRFINAILQFKFKFAGIELSRFLINTTIGVLGFTDPARDRWKLFKHNEDFGQTLGFYGSGPGFYINWPLIGPSSPRDTIGLIADYFLDPTSYLFPHDPWGVVALRAYREINETSLEIGVYESLRKESFDPYIAIRNAYHQHRESKIKE